MSVAIPEGLCQCGCGQPTGIARKTNRAKGYKKGHPRRFRPGHNPGPKGSEHVAWKEEGAGYKHIHAWMNRTYPRLGICEECGAEGRTEWSNKDHEYRRVREDWRELCPPCHKRIDMQDRREHRWNVKN